MSELLVVPLKKPTEVDVEKPLKNLIHSAYSTSENVDYSEAVSEFAKLRNNAVWKAFEKNGAALEILSGYVQKKSHHYVFAIVLFSNIYTRHTIGQYKCIRMTKKIKTN